MKNRYCLAAIVFTTALYGQKIFDVHVHGDAHPGAQMSQLAAAGVYKMALSTSWDLQTTYQNPSVAILQGLMLACPDGKVPYSANFCFPDRQDFPDLAWVEQQIRDKKIDFLGEVLTQYYGVSPSDEKLHPYYALAEKHGLPVGIHTGLAGPGHGSTTFKVGLGSPLLMEALLQRFPKLKVWIMHAGAPFLEDTLAIMAYYRNVYADISAISNPDIFPAAAFRSMVRQLIDAGMEDRLMFGSDNGDIAKILDNIDALGLSEQQKQKLLYKNAETFFSR